MRTLSLSLLLAALPVQLLAQGKIGLGVVLGEPTGISAKLWTGNEKALAFGVAWGGWDHGGYLHLHGDRLFHHSKLIRVDRGKLPLHYGPGIRLRSWSARGYWHNGRHHDQHLQLGIRFPVGLTYIFDQAPVDIFLELVPTLELVPSTYLDLDLGIGVRYWFK